MKKISILTFTFSILLLLGVSCSIVDESLFLETSIEKSPINNNHVFVKDTVLTEDLLKFKHMTDSIALSSPYLAKIDTVYNQSKK